MSRRVDTSSTTWMVQIMGKHWRSRGYLSNEILKVIHQQDDCGKDKSKQLYENLDGRKFRAGNVCSVIGNKSNFCQKTWTTKNGWKEAECGSKVEEIDDTSGHRRTHIISWSRVLGMHSAGMQTEWNKYWAVYKAVRITYFCWEQQKITGMGKTSSTNSSVVLRHGRTCSKMRWTILWTGKQESGATVQSFKPLFGWWSVQTRGARISCRNITSLLTQFLRMLVLCTRRPDILWSVNKLARSVTKWTQACDKRLARLISSLLSCEKTRNSIVDQVCFKIPTLLVILRTQKST